MPTNPDSHPSIYQRFFTPAERAGLHSAPLGDPSSEINLIRILLMRVLQVCSDAPSLDLDTQAGVLSAFSQAGLTMTALYRVSARLERQKLELNDHLGLGDPEAAASVWPTVL